MRILLAAYASICLGVLILADLGRLNPVLLALASAPMADKVAHALAAGMLALLINLTLLQRGSLSRARSLVAGTLTAAALCTIEEATNALTPYRGCEPLDLVANYLGILGIGLVPLLLWRRALAVSAPA